MQKACEVGNNGEKDINDVFDDLLLSEEHLRQNSYNEGFKIGKYRENIEAFHLGYHRGAELGSEIGYISSVTDSYLKFLTNNEEDNERIIKELMNLQKLLEAFPDRNDENVHFVELLEPFLRLANCHMVDFFTESTYRKYLPQDIQNEIEQIGSDKIIDLIFTNDFRQTPALANFANASAEFTLKNCPEVCLSYDDFLQNLQNWGCNKIDKFKLNVFMNSKKSHEVQILGAISAALAKISNVSHLIDIGDGKGYLSSMLALHYGIPIVGIDASNTNTCGAIMRATKLSKVWKGIVDAPLKSYPARSDATASANVNLYKQVTAFVDENFDLERLVQETFVLDSPSLRLGLVGLHTCGNLTPDSLKLFLKNESIQFICNVGCCYHLITEKFEHTASEVATNFGFPMSRFLTKKEIFINRSARMISNQSLERILHARELPNITIFYRALFQVLLEKNCGKLPTKHVGKFRKPPKNFLEYSRISLKRIEVNLDISDEEIEHLARIYQSRINELNIFYLLRCKLSPVIESLILLDRLLFMHEQGVENSFLVQFFDPVVSPRCYGIVAMKKSINI